MTEIELLRSFFAAYEELQSFPKVKGAPGPEKRAAMEALEIRANAVREGVSHETIVATTPKVDPNINLLRSMQAQVAAIEPKRGNTKWPQ
jgi:hypothetical protein